MPFENCLLWSPSYIWNVLFSIWSFGWLFLCKRGKPKSHSGTLCKENCGTLPASILRSQIGSTEPAFCVLCDVWCGTSPLSWSPASTDLPKLKEESYSAFPTSLGKRDLIVLSQLWRIPSCFSPPPSSPWKCLALLGYPMVTCFFTCPLFTLCFHISF